jgi:hypothetical protein
MDMVAIAINVIAFMANPVSFDFRWLFLANIFGSSTFTWQLKLGDRFSEILGGLGISTY